MITLSDIIIYIVLIITVIWGRFVGLRVGSGSASISSTYGRISGAENHLAYEQALASPRNGLKVYRTL